MSVRIGLLRHGRTSWNRQGRLQGQVDTDLEKDEIARLSALDLPAEWRGAAVLSSPLQRARDTARLITGAIPQTDNRLMEIALGEWEGRYGEDLAADPDSGFLPIEEWGWDYRPHGGESPRHMWERISPVLDGLTEDTLVVSHMVVMRVILARAHNWDFDGPAPFRIKRNRIYGLTLANGVLTPDSADPVRLVTRCA